VSRGLSSGQKSQNRQCSGKSGTYGNPTLIGHTPRDNSLLKRIMEGMIEGKNVVGRPPLDYLQQINNEGCARAKLQTNEEES